MFQSLLPVNLREVLMTETRVEASHSGEASLPERMMTSFSSPQPYGVRDTARLLKIFPERKVSDHTRPGPHRRARQSRPGAYYSPYKRP